MENVSALNFVIVSAIKLFLPSDILITLRHYQFLISAC